MRSWRSLRWTAPAAALAWIVAGCGTSEPVAPSVVGREAVGAEAVVVNAGWGVAFVPDREPGGCTVASQRNDWETVTLVMNCRQVDWRERRGEAWGRFTAGLSQGFDAGCRRLFERSRRGALYDGAIEYTLDDCTRLKPTIRPDDNAGVDIPARLPPDPRRAGHERGARLGCVALFKEEGFDALADVPDGPARERRDTICGR